MLALNLLPGTGLGCFSLGCSINQALINIRQAQTTFGCVELKYFEKTTSLDDILLNLPEHGVHLIFESSSQTLRLIEVYDLSRLQVKRGAATVGGSAHPPTFQALYDLMGPTYPGQVDTAHGCYVMHWPGLLVLFPIASQHAASWQDMQQGRALPLALPDGTAPVASRLCIHAGNAVSLGDLVQAISPANFESPPSVGIRVGKGLTMDDTHQQLSFGDSPQDAWSTLGAPNATFSKQTPGLPQQGSANIRGAQQQVPASPADYFYNYFDRGLDVLFCGTTHRIKKMVLHTNCPNHTSFGTYSKCHFTLHAQSSTTHKALQQDGMSSDATSQQKSDSRSPFGDNTGGPEGFWDHQHNGQADESQEAQVLYGGKPILQPDYLEAWLDPDLPVQDWMLQAEGAHKSASSPDYSPAAPAAVQQALLDDIKAMTRADSDAGSSDSSMTQEGAPFSAGTVPQTGEVTPPSHPPDAQGTDRASLGAVDKASPQPQRQQTTGGAPSVPRQHHSAKVDCRHEEEEQQAQQLPEVEARAELAGSGESAPVDFGDEGGSAGDVGSEGWDDADPMAMLSQSVQSLARAQQAESELRSSEPAQHVVMQSGSVAAGTPRADPHSHTSSEVLSARLVGAAETGQTALSSNSIRQDASSWTAQEVPSGIMPEHPEAASETVLVSAGESAELQSRGSRSGSYDGNDANSSAQAGNGLAGGLESACLEHDASASVLTADSTWAEVENVLGKGNRAVIHTRGVGGGPYGPTMVHGYPGIVFEVTQAGQVASVTLFDF
ncbi:TPA: hypothetical protein ACH3X2_004708 [Trebouxia sp. C0005]